MDVTKFDQLLRAAGPVECKFAASPLGEFSGYASLFGGAPDAQGHVIASGAFAKSLAAHAAAGSAPVMLWSHLSDAPIGRWESITEDARGLRVAGRLNLDSERGREAHAHLRAGDVNGLSIGYRLPMGGAQVNGDGSFTLTEIELLEISVVAIPAASRARITEVKHLSSQADLERLLHASGLARGAAAKLAAGGFPALAGPEPDEAAIHRIRSAFADLSATIRKG